jgi:hypothetical protein
MIDIKVEWLESSHGSLYLCLNDKMTKYDLWKPGDNFAHFRKREVDKWAVVKSNDNYRLLEQFTDIEEAKKYALSLAIRRKP